MRGWLRARRVVPVALLLALVFTSGAFAQDYYYTTFQVANRDFTLPDAPCVVQGSAQPLVYDHSAWVFYTCTDGRVIARRFFHPNDRANEPASPLPSAPASPTPTATSTASCDATKMVGFTGLNECQWVARYPR
jgi:hypothetical protein